ncbi:unnamed protein product [Diatraea saccharalis]|uniref:Uncharacterized protein n=1 Tax=Diatraea saccharalis TaxID=40085 RepID=A0A9N9R4T0_9NEOP|nr:unnamed protein product [Diatraea saccharalis]
MIMLCRALLTALAISYLICVLWLSGLQKEDLDVNILRKLQRHNVNIDDKNPDDLKQDCLNTDTRRDNKKEEKNITDEDTMTTTSTFETETVINKKYDESELKNDLSTILDNIMDKQKQKAQEKDSIVIGENLEIGQSPRLENISDNENSRSTAEFQIEETHLDNDKSKLENVINFWKKMANPNTKNYNIAVTKRTKMTKKRSKKKTITKTTSNEAISKEAEHLNKLLATYFNKNTNSPTTQSSIISSADLSNLRKLTKQFENFFKLMSQNKIIHNNNEKTVMANLTENYDSVKDNNVNFNNNNMPQQAFIMRASKKKFVDNDSKKHSISDISGLLLFNDQLKRSFTLPNNTFSPPYLMPIIGQLNNNQQFYTTPESEIPTTNQPITIVKDKIRPQEINVFPKDVIEKIAENVKEKVLEDLRKETASTTSQYTTTSTVTTTTAATSLNNVKTTKTDLVINGKPFENKTEDANLILKTITELFKEFKAFKQMSISTTPHPNEKFEANKLPTQIVNTHIIKKQTEPKISYQSVVPQNIVQMYATADSKKNIRLNIPMQPQINTMKHSAIIQTNSGEIPPLSIPVSNPLKLIHQNIVVTTARHPVQTVQSKEPWIINSYKSNDRHSNHSQYRYIPSHHLIHNSIEQQPNHLKHSPLISHGELNRSQYNHNSFHRDNDRLQYLSDQSHHYTDHTRYNSNPSHPDSTRLRYDSDHLKLNPITSKYDLRFSNYNTGAPMFKRPTSNERYNIRNEMARHIDQKSDDKLAIINRSSDYRSNIQPTLEDFYESNIRDLNKSQYKNISSDIYRHPVIKGFHERLERVDNWQGEDTSKCCEDLALASRQQLALNTMKTNYDDTHFKDFLKTQQRVNDMLEKILSSKTSEPRSVEII